jgi:hypothetical protein
MQEVCEVLEGLVASGTLKSYAIGGATAAGLHGEPLATRDIDVFVFIDPPAGSLLITLEPLFRYLKEIGFGTFEEEAILIHGFPVQFLCANPGLETEALDEAISLSWDHHELRVMRPEHLAAIALTVGRPKDRARLVFLVSLPDFDRTRFKAILLRHGLYARWEQWAAGLGLEPVL